MKLESTTCLAVGVLPTYSQSKAGPLVVNYPGCRRDATYQCRKRFQAELIKGPDIDRVHSWYTISFYVLLFCDDIVYSKVVKHQDQ